MRKSRLHKRIFDGIGDIDTRGATGDDRIAILNSEERVALSHSRAAAELSIRTQFGRWRDAHEKYVRARTRRLRRESHREHMLSFSEAWKHLGVEERYPQVHLHWTASMIVFIVLGGLDFYVFAQAYAVVDDAADFSYGWWIGGLLGLVVFVAGVIVARQLKIHVLSSAQAGLVEEYKLEDPEFRPVVSINGKNRHLPQNRVNIMTLVLSVVLFLFLTVLAFIVRLGDEDTGLPATLMTAAVPLVIVAVELYMYDPLDRKRSNAGWWERHLYRKAMLQQRRLDTVIKAYEKYILKLRAQYAQERKMAAVEASDRGISVSSKSISDEGIDISEWQISLESLLESESGKLVQSNERDLPLLGEREGAGAF